VKIERILAPENKNKMKIKKFIFMQPTADGAYSVFLGLKIENKNPPPFLALLYR